MDWTKEPAKSACVGTDCDGPTGSPVTEYNPNPPATKKCDHLCKRYVMNFHEQRHRENLRPCCELYSKCGKKAQADSDKEAMDLCFAAWTVWKQVNERSLEELAAVDSCEAAKRGLSLYPWAIKQPWADQIPEDCCRVLEENRDLQCNHMNPGATLEACPFQQDGEVDLDQFDRLMDLLMQKKPKARKVSR